MITPRIIEPVDYVKFATELDAMFQLRARVFRDHLRWDVIVIDGRERDKYDWYERPVYVVALDGRNLIGSLRLLPTTGPTLLADKFADTCPDIAGLTSPSIWECTRACVSSDDPEATLCQLYHALGMMCLEKGISTIIGNTNASMFRWYQRLSPHFRSVGRNEQGVLLVSFPVNEATVRDFDRYTEAA